LNQLADVQNQLAVAKLPHAADVLNQLAVANQPFAEADRSQFVVFSTNCSTSTMPAATAAVQLLLADVQNHLADVASK